MYVQLFWTLLTTRLSISILVRVVIQCHTYEIGMVDSTRCTFSTVTYVFVLHLCRVCSVRACSKCTLHISSSCSELVVTFLMPKCISVFCGWDVGVTHIRRVYILALDLSTMRIERSSFVKNCHEKNISIGDIFWRNIFQITHSNDGSSSSYSICSEFSPSSYCENVHCTTLEFISKHVYDSNMRSSPQISLSCFVSCHWWTNIFTFQPNTTNTINTKTK